MPITQIHIQNYKSLKNLTLKMNPFMVFVGPNNAGKSNIFNAFRFLSDFVQEQGRQSAVRERGGFEQIVFDGDIGQTISFEFHGRMEVHQKERYYKYFIELEGDRWGNWLNRRETFMLMEEDEKVLLEFPSEEGTANAFDETGEQIGSIGAGNTRSYLSSFTDQRRYPIVGRFAHEVEHWAFFNLLPPLMRESLPVRKQLQLQSFGENLAVVPHVLQSEEPQRFKEVEDILRTAIPELEELTTGLTAHDPGQTYIRIREKGLKTTIPAWGMSDGTLRLLGHLATLYSPSPPSLVCFEEPENYVHPQLLELIVELLKNAASETQVLVTTHSPYLVDLLQPEDLFIVEKQEGKTQVKQVADQKEIKEALKALGLGELWYSGSFGGVS